MNVIGAEAEHERSARLAVGPDTEPLLRTLLRLRHDLVMIEKAVVFALSSEPVRWPGSARDQAVRVLPSPDLRASGARYSTSRSHSRSMP